MVIASLTDHALRQTLEELKKGRRLDHHERERLIRIWNETETAINALGSRMMAAELVIEAYEAEVSARAERSEAVE
jgi:hypothetical protein